MRLHQWLHRQDIDSDRHARRRGQRLVGGKSIAPFHPVRNRRPDKCNCRLPRIGLTKNGVTDFLIQLLIGKFNQELLLQGQVTVDSRIKALDVQDAEIRLKSVETARRGNGSQRIPGIKLLPCSLGGPQKKRQFFKGDCMTAIGYPAFPVLDSGLNSIMPSRWH